MSFRTNVKDKASRQTFQQLSSALASDYIPRNGTLPLTADWDAGSFEIRAETFQSDIATGTAPFTVASTTVVTNLNVDLLDGQHGTYYLDSANFTGTNWTDLTDAGVTTLHKHNASGVLLPTGIGTPTVDDLQDYIQYTGSAGFYSGGTITNGAAGKINIAEVEGFIRTSASDTAAIVAFKLAAQTDVTIPSDTIRYVYVDYNGGSPAIALSASEFDEEVNYVLIGVAINEGGTIVHKANVGVRLDESIAKAGLFLRCVLGISRCNRRGGLIIGETGTRNITLTTGRLWWGRTEYEITAVDTSVSGTVAFNYYTGAAWASASSAQWPNTEYNDITSGLVTMTANRWAVLWFYLTVDNTFQCVYGRNQYTTQAAAEQEAKPSTLPNDLSALGILVGRAIFQKSASTATWYSAFTTTFNAIGITDHGDLSGLSDNDHPQYVRFADTSTATMSFVIDEDNMASDSATKVPTQQSVKAYVDAASGWGPASAAMAMVRMTL